MGRLVTLTLDNIDSCHGSRFSGLMSINATKTSGLSFKKELLLSIRFALILGLFVAAQSAFAQSTTSKIPKRPARTKSESTAAQKSVLSMPSAQQRSVFGQVRFESLQYFTKLDEAPELTNSQFLSGRITATSYDRDPFSLNWAADVSAGTFFSLKQSYYSVQELYVATPLSENTNLSMGRKKYDWSEIDRIWALGVWHPRYAIDALRPEDQGLTGFFLDYKRGGIQVVGFASPMFIPTVGPDIREEDGQLRSDNRWFRPPSSQAGKIDLTYKIETGDIWKLVQQESYALRVRLGEEESGPWIGVAGGRKPVNDLLFQRCLHCVPPSAPAKFVVSPQVVHHDIYSTDIGYQFETWKISASYLEDHPDQYLPPFDFAVQNIMPVKMYSAQLDWNVREMLGRPLQLQIGYLRTVGDEIVDIESNGQESDFTLFEDRFRFSNAALLKVIGEIMTIRARPLVTKVAYLREFDQRGSILGVEFQYQWNRTWSFLVGFDSLGVEKSSTTNSGFISDYRANDRIYAGASYVF